MSLFNLFVDVDNFLPNAYLPAATTAPGLCQPTGTQTKLATSEVMTIIIYFHQSRYRDFKTYYTQYVRRHLHREFPNLVSYSRFVKLMPTALWRLCCYLKTWLGPVSVISFIDPTALPVCHNRCIQRHMAEERQVTSANPLANTTIIFPESNIQYLVQAIFIFGMPLPWVDLDSLDLLDLSVMLPCHYRITG